MAKILINIRSEEKENAVLEAYCQQTGRTKTDVLREYTHSLPEKVGKSE
jgi:hypothetical protein